MAGAYVDSLNIVQLITDNLRDRYKSGFPILKEIVQNADDAGATELNLGWHPGLKNAKHPLLKYPAVFFINNAPLSEEDAKAIRSLGLGNKADDQNAVGKFGLGMKSLFHLGEVYFFLGSDWNQLDDKSLKAEVFNPWNDYREHWNTFDDADKELLQASLRTIADKEKNDYEFIVWVPLRSKTLDQKNKVNQEDGYIIESTDYKEIIPGFLTDLDLPEKLAKLLPMLKKMHTISAYEYENSGKAQLLFSIKLQDSAITTRFSEIKDLPATLSALSGDIVISQKSKEETLIKFYGQEQKLDSKEISELKENTFWPKSYGRDKYSQKEIQIEDKAQPHAATVLITTPTTSQAKLRILWAVFLPLGDLSTDEAKQVYEVEIDGKLNVDLVLHGYFFIDAGRVGIHGRNWIGTESTGELTSEDDVRREWNRLLANNGTLPLILKTLSKAAEQGKFKAEQIKSITSGLKRFFDKAHLDGKDFLKYVTSHKNWVFSVGANQNAWALIPSSQQIRPLPYNANRTNEEIWQILPSLKSFEGYTYIAAEQPNIATEEPCWRSSELNQLITNIPSDVFTQKTHLDYLKEFLQQNTNNLNDVLTILFRKVLQEVALEKLSSVQSSIKGILELISSYKVNYLNLDKTQQALWDKLKHLDFERLIVPSFLQPEEHKNNNFLFSDAENILAYTANSFVSDDDKKKVYDQIFKQLSSTDKKELRTRRASLPLYQVYKLNSKTNRIRCFISWSEIKQSKENGFLFRIGDKGLDDFGLAKELQQALLPSPELFFINRALNNDVFEGAIQPCDEESIIKVLQKRPSLNSPAHRIDLLNQLRKEVADKLAIRYLIHAFPEDTNEPLWEITEDSPVWSKLLKTSDKYQPWSIIDGAISRELRLSSSQKKDLGIKSVGSKDVLTELSDELKNLNFSEVITNQDEAESILKEIDSRELWRELPLHKTKNGEFVAINNKTYLHSNKNYPDRFKNELVWLEPAISNSVAKQQRENIDELTEERSLELALESFNPTELGSFIFELLESIGIEKLSETIKEKTVTTKWLELNGTKVAPNKIINASSADYPQTYRLARNTQAFYFLENLKDNKEKLDKIKPFFIQKPEEIINLAFEQASENASYYIGPSREDLLRNKKLIKELAKLNNKSQGWLLLRECEDKAPDITANKISELAKGGVEQNFLDELYQLACEKSQKYEAARHFLLYQITKIENAKELLHKLKLSNSNNELIYADELCHDVIGISKTNLIHSKDWDIIKHILQAKQHGVLDEEHARLADHNKTYATEQSLRAYFSDWENRVPDKLAIAAVLALMAGTDGVANYCESYLGQQSLKRFINQIGQHWETQEKDNRNSVLFAGDSLFEAVNKMEFSISTIGGNKAKVYSIFAEEIEVELDKDYSSIFVWGTHNFSDNSLGLTLRDIPIDTLREEQLSKILQLTAEQLLHRVYGQNLKLDHIWESFQEPEQLDVLVTKRIISKNLLSHFKDLGVNDDAVKELINEYRELETQIAEAELDSDGKKSRILYAQEKITKLLEALEQRLDEDKSLQLRTLEAVRNKIEDARYSKKSVPFEIFQNSDDALCELERLHDSTSAELFTEFIVQYDQSSINFMHWGREVNQFKLPSGTHDGRKDGYAHDLEKMIRLNYSDKSGSATTGKFGLGFKSCLLITDYPYIFSGRLAVRINGGLLPEVVRLEKQHAQLIERARTKAQGKKPTLIYLPAIKDINIETNVIRCFESHAGLLPVLARKIRLITINEQEYRWNPKVIPNLQGFTHGTVLLPTEKRLQERKILVYQGSGRNIFIFRLGPKGLELFNQSVIKLWDLAPIHLETDQGFVINSTFQLDIGRNQLAINSEENSKQFERLGEDLGQLLLSLYEFSKNNFAALKKELQLDETLDLSEFWAKTWSVITKNANSGNKNEDDEKKQRHDYDTVLASRLFTTRNGIKDFYFRTKAMPTGLNNDLVAIKTVKYRTSELLSKKDVFERLKGLSPIDNWLRNEALVNYEIGQTLLKLGYQPATKCILDVLAEILEKENYLTLSIAKSLAKVFTSSFFESFKKHEGSTDKISDIKNKLKEQTIKSQTGSYISLSDCIIPFTDAEAKLISKFAPPNKVISDKYKEVSNFLVDISSSRAHFGENEIYEFICNHDETCDDLIKQAICEYLIDGKYGQEVAIEIGKSIQPYWLWALPGQVSELRKWGWNKQKISKLILLLKPEEQTQVFEKYEKQELAGRKASDGALERIYNWWLDNKEHELPAYEKRVYPNGLFDWQAIREYSNPERYEKAWLQLLFLGSCQTIGRAKDEQHRTALELFEQRGWWDVFVQPEEHSQWFEVLDDYLKRSLVNEQYRTWLQILPLYRFSKFKDNYIELFLQANRMPNIPALVSPATSEQMSGSGSDFLLPELKATLGIGVNFILRELVRNKVIEPTEEVVKHCFSLPKSVRERIFERIPNTPQLDGSNAENSQRIHHFLCRELGEEKATFTEDFDIPFRALLQSENENKLNEILGF